MKYIIGIDAGATKSELVAYDLDFKIIYKDMGGYGNPSVSLNNTIENLGSLIEKCLLTLNHGQCIFLAAGIAGVDRGNIKEVIRDYIFSRFSIENIILNDVVMAAKAYLGEDDGILTIAGTGSSCYVQKDNLGRIVGGWGHILGDEGSGYHTVIEGFKRVIYQIDNNIPLDSLSHRLLKEIKDLNYPDIKSFIYENDKRGIASLFPIIVEVANEGKSEAITLLENAGKHLAGLTISAYNRFSFEDSIKIGLKGGVFYHSEQVLSVYVNEISEQISDFQLIKEDISVTKAVCNIYKIRGK